MLHNITSTKPKILVADDELANRLLLERILSPDYEVDFAVNGQDTLNKLDECDYDALLLDVMMPILNGISTLEIIRQKTDLATLPIILVSALTDTNTIVAGIELGANDYITKPIDPQIVRARLQTQVTLKHLMTERNDAIAALDSANKMKAHMMQIASHDLKNPLNNLGMLLEVISSSVAVDEQLKNLFRLADDSIEAMVNIINDFLSSQNLAEGNIEAELEELSGKSLVYSVLDQYELAAAKKNMEISVDCKDDDRVLADEKRMNQVISNLLSNAIKYSPVDSQINIRLESKQDTWRLEIQDAGPGIPENERQYLFKAFSKYQISTTPTANESSTGLGLWIAAEMMRLQDGAIGMDSPPEGGCCFWVELPLATESIAISA